MNQFVLAEMGKPVVGVAPVDIGGAAKTSDYFSMENYSHASILIVCGLIGNAATITLFQSDDSSGSTSAAIAFKYYQVTAGVTGARTTATTAGFSTGTDANAMFIIELDAADLAEGYPWVTVKTTNAAANVIAIIPILSGARYAQDVPPSAI